MHFLLAAFLALEIVSSGIFSQDISPPDVENFNIVLSKELEFRVDDYKTAFVGRVVVYQNPDDPNEYTRVYYRQIAIISERAQEKSISETGVLENNSSNLNYHLKQEEEVLDRVQQATDAFAYVKWRTDRDPRTGQDFRAGPLQSWLLEQNGNWVFSSELSIFTMPFSERSKANPDKLIIVGIQFTLAGGSHVVRIDQDELIIYKKGSVDDKK
ncbi:MAG: hypothetical protein UT29_C0002G0029 [Candidatus Yanofskybacteria bacterium GW2011_GWA1_39_13]|uniref:Uncharacterized protein n=1 Tax=Yanofskybacteria sp. (strain GW2011_GWA1_39_13) TaxID=1619019 RepID=A0A0G0QL91_YANXG|nr:MAG: hypothetical protein UT29_C0002G0029 [Candidatus Yanofskybacteria bacterium GW2011_GWA1_39_13]